MSRIGVISIVLLAIVVEFCGIFIGKHLGLSQFASVSVGSIAALLLAFPIMRLYGHLSFTQWIVSVFFIVVAANLVNLIIG